MPFDGSGNFTRSYNFVNDKNGGIKIVASRMDAEFDNYASALNQVLLRSGVAGMTGSLNMGTNTINSIGNGTVSVPAIRFNTDPTSGIYMPGYAVVGMSILGVERLQANSTGVLVSGTFGVTGTSAFQGATTVNGTLQVNNTSTVTGQANFGANISSGTGVSTGDVVIELGGNRTGSGNVYIDMHSTNGTDYEARILRNTGVNGDFQILQTGVGAISLENTGTGNIRFATGGIERGRVYSGGGWQFGNTFGASAGAFVNIGDGAFDGSNYGRSLQITTVSGNRQQAAFVRSGFNVLSMGYNGATATWGMGAGSTVDSTWSPNYLAIDMTNSRIGMGTSTPGTELEVYKASAGIITSRVFNPNTTSGAGAAFDVLTGSPNVSVSHRVVDGPSPSLNITYGSAVQLSYNDCNNHFFRNNGGSLTKMLINATGDVAIGTTISASPAYALDVQRSGANVSAIVARNASVNMALRADNSAGVLGTQSASPIVFIINSADVGRFQPNGNLSIGTSNERTRLYVSAASTFNAPVLGSGFGGIAYFTNSDTSYGLVLGNSSLTGAAWLQAQRGDATALAYDILLNPAGGNVGVGRTPSTNMRIDVEGRGRFLQDATGGGVTVRSSTGDTTGGYVQFTNNAASVQLGTIGVDTSGNMSLASNSSIGLRVLVGGIPTDGSNRELGFRDLPQNAQAGAYTLVADDRGKHVYATGGAAAITIPPNSSVAFNIGTAVTIVNDGSGARTLTQGAGVTLKQAGTGTAGNRTLAVGGIATLLKVGTDTWYVSGVGVT